MPESTVLNPDNDAQLRDTRIDIKLQLSALWAAATLCYLYCDYFELYQPGKLQSMLAGQMGPLGQTAEGVLLGVSVMLSLSAVMIFLSIALPAKLSRVANLLFGLLFTLIMLVFLFAPRVWLYYKYFAAIEVMLTCTVIYLAWKWPRGQSKASA
jgi:hypothetical protein